LGGWASFARAQEPAPPNAPKVGSIEAEFVIKVKLQYYLYLPKAYEVEKDKKWPLVIFLHGAGERGSDLEQLKKHGPPRLIGAGKEFPAIVVAPQCPRDGRWQPQPVLKLLDDLQAKYPIDPDRVYLTGLSMGGYGTWALLAAAPDRFAAAVPICGAGDPTTAPKFKHVPIHVFHGTKDGAVPFAKSEEMVKALKDAGSNVQFTIYEGVGHDSWTETYNNEAMWDWLFKQRRSSPGQ